MDKIIQIILIFLFAVNSGIAQISGCIEIEDILVDGCGSPEGQNERITFRVGSTPLNVSNLNVQWPNNPFLGICQTAQTAQTVAQFNAQILGCGYVLEPVNGILPANKRVMIFTSEYFSTAAYSMANLNDTVIALFQCGATSNGHFANYSATPGLRTTIISFSSPSPCADTATYNISLLVNIYGGYGGSAADRNGSSVSFINNNVVYYNNGCNPPFVPVTVDAGAVPGSHCPGQFVQLSGSITGTPQSYQWSGGGGNFSFQSSLNTFYTISANDAGGVWLKLTANTCNGPIVDSVFINVPSQNVLQLNPSGSQSICPGQSISVTASGGSGNYLWNGVANIPTINITSGGTYVVQSSDACYQYTDSVIVTELTMPIASIDTSANTTLCPGDNITLTASGGVNYQWLNGPATPHFTVNAAGNYSVTVSNQCGADVVSIQINSSPAVNAQIVSSGGLQLCPGDSLTLIASGGSSYLWNNTSTNNSIVVFNQGTYSVDVSGFCGTSSASVNVTSDTPPQISLQASGPLSFCAGQNVILIASGFTSYQWSNGSTGDSYTASQTENVWVAASNNCGSDTAFASLVMNPMPQAAINQPGSFAICPGQTLNLISSGNYSTAWNTGTNNPILQINAGGSYFVVDSGLCGSDTAFIFITQENFPQASITSPQNFEECQGNAVTLNGSGGTSFIWSTGQTSSSINTFQSGIYSYVAQNICGVDTAAVSVIITPIPIASFQASGPLSFCAGQNVSLTFNGIGNFQWSEPNSTGTITLNQAGNYYLTAFNKCGADTLFFTTQVFNPIASFNQDILFGESPLIVQFNNTGQNYNYSEWYFGNGNYTNTTSPSELFTAAGIYEIVLVNSDLNGCYDTATSKLEVVQGSEIFYPNAFTPNGDELNDVFKVMASGVESFQAFVYDRWGTQIFRWDDIKSGWDGLSSSGEMVPMGVYVVNLNFKLVNGNSREITDKITLVR